MSEVDFHIDYYIEVPNLAEKYKIEAEQRLRSLTEGWNDFIGAAITIEEIAGVESPFIYQARIVAYIKPENIAIVVKRETPETALNEALSTLEDRIRQERERRRKVWQRPDLRTDMSLYELSPKEVYDTYTAEVPPETLLKQARSQIASDLMINEKLDQESAYYAADLILEHAQRKSSNRRAENGL